ncbi:MAG: tetratricopeptide repeat protein [Lachnospiraceae bacterium]|nr:tetratricopeptide repeat protein [Lachnospiraceae bacterium]
MVCYQCGVRLSEHDFCTGCGADVALYKKLLSTSNRLYNEALEKAGVRDLAGAISVLKQSLKYNKNNIKARNLLGLCYFEIGEAVSALSEWVISKNIRPAKNIADDYISMIQTNQTRLDTINQTIKKYNQALSYCHQDSRDLAIIQLKKVLSYNPKYVRAHQLLALLYIGEEEWNLAKNELQRCNEIDTNNTITLRYLKEVNRMMMPEDLVKGNGKKSGDDVVRYQSGNETIIQPGRSRDFRILSTLFNFGIGISIGVAIAVSLILPGRLRQAQFAHAEQIRIIGEELDVKTAAINALELRERRLLDENENLAAELSEFLNDPVSDETSDNLLMAAALFIFGPTEDDDEEEISHLEKIASYLDGVSLDELLGGDQAFKELYDSIISVIGTELGDLCYEVGYEYFRMEEYASAIPHLLRAFQYDPDNGEALWNLANAYEQNNEIDKAKEAYARVIEFFPDTDKARRADERLIEINITGA